MDDDAKLWKLAKCTSVKQYRHHKAILMESRGTDPETGEEIPSRLEIRYQTGPIRKGISTPISTPYLTSGKCTQQLGTASRMRHAKSEAGKASAAARKRLKTYNSRLTAEPTKDATEQSTETQHIDQRTGQRNEASVPDNLKAYSTNKPPYTPHGSEHAGSGSLDAHPDRSPQLTARQPAEDVEVLMPSGAKIRINGRGTFDEIFAPLDCPDTLLTPAQALELRAKVLAERDAPPPQTPPSRPPKPTIVPPDRISPITAKVWEIAGQTTIRDAWRAAKKMEDYQQVIAWIALGWTEDDITDAAQISIGSAGEINDLWGYLASTMPDIVKTFRAKAKTG